MAAEFDNFINKHESQLLSCQIPNIYWNTLFQKLKYEVFDANDYFSFVYDNNGELHPVVSCEEGLKQQNADSVFLIDHAWTYESEYSRAQLRTIPGLAKRMASLMDLIKGNKEAINGKEEKESSFKPSPKMSPSPGFYTNEEGKEFPNEQMVELIFQNTWKFNQTYQVKVMEQRSDVESSQTASFKEQVCFWYIMDEFGSRISHSDLPTCSLRCFFFMDREISYSVLFPRQDLCYGDASLSTSSFVQDSRLARCRESYLEECSGVKYLPTKDCYTVYTDIDVVAKSLQEPKFRLIEEPKLADIIWIADHFKDYKSLQEAGTQYINQFPFENVLTCKDLLSRVVSRVGLLSSDRCESPGTTRPPWFQETYNLTFELPRFIHNFNRRAKRNEDNTWIIKPWNLGRSIDTHVTDNLNHIIRLRETGPKIISKYIHDPVLLEREDVGKVKFHFRYMAAVTSVDPLIVDIDKVFWIGCANKPFSLDAFDVYEKHFTTMNYRQGVVLKQVHHDEFPEMFDRQNPGYKWQDIENEVHRLIKELFEAATSETPPRGIAHCKMSRAYYALDFMLKWADDGSKRMQPVLLEVNFNPDCNRLVQFHPKSFHHLFSSLFLGEKTPWECIRL